MDNWIRDYENAPIQELAVVRRWGLLGLAWWRKEALARGYYWDGLRGIWYKP